MAIYDICTDLQLADERAKKELILYNARNTPIWLKTMRYLFDPILKSGMSEKRINRVVWPSGVGSSGINSLSDMYEYLWENNTGKDDDVGTLQQFISEQEPEYERFLYTLFSKQLRMGVDITTLNRIYGRGFILQVNCMLAYPFNEKDLKGQEFTLTLKLDGIRCIATKQDGKVTLYSRGSKIFEGLYEIERALQNHPQDNFIWDGELLASDWEYMKTPSTIAYKAAIQAVKPKGPKKGVTFWVFDGMPLDVYKDLDTSKSYIERRKVLDELWMGYRSEVLQLLPILYQGSDISAISAHTRAISAAKQEGLMLNINLAPYAYTRSKSLLKIKKMKDTDLVVIGVEEGKGRLEGMLGNFVCEYKGGEVRVGTGLNDYQRKHLYSQRDALHGKIITINYFEETKNAKGQPSLRFPTFLRLRED